MMHSNDILETIRMLEQEHLDIRTVTLGVSLLDCGGDTLASICEKIYDKITRAGASLASTCRQVELSYGMPIVNKRISVTPLSLLAGMADSEDAVPLALSLERAALEIGVDFIGGFSALVHKGTTVGDRRILNALPQALAATERVCASVNVATTRAGINMDAVARLGHILCQTARQTAERDSIGCAKLVVFANAPEDNPFMAGAFHGVGEAETAVSVGVSGPGTVAAAIERAGACSLSDLAEVVKRTAFKITRMGQLAACEISKRLGVEFGIVDLSLAPTPARGDSVARILTAMGLETVGGHGSTVALALLNDAVKKGGVMASSQVGGLSGAFIPVSEDAGMIEAARAGHLSLAKLEAMTAVCSVGLDMVAVPGDTPPETLSAIIADEAAIGVINNKATAARLIPVWGKTVGQEANFGGLLGTAPILPVHPAGCAAFVNRGGRIPAPIHSQRN